MTHIAGLYLPGELYNQYLTGIKVFVLPGDLSNIYGTGINVYSYLVAPVTNI